MNVLYYPIREIKNLFEYYLIPFLVVIFPHKIYYSIYKFICSYTFFYNIYSKGSYQCGIKLTHNSHNEKAWTRNVKLLHLMDISDPWLAWFRPKKAKKILKKQGEWLNQGGFLALNAHWGTGFLALIDMKNSGFNPFFVFSDTPVAFKHQGVLEKFYRKFRRKYVNKVSGSVAIAVGGGYQNIKQKIDNKDVPVILFDAPRNNKKSQYSLKILNHHYSIASGFVNLICRENTPFQLFSVKLDFETGLRELRIEKGNGINSEQVLLNMLSSYFENLLKQSPELWFLWRHSETLFVKQ